MTRSFLLGAILAALLGCKGGSGGGGGGDLGGDVGDPPPPGTPVARLTASPDRGIAPLVVSFDGSASTDPDGDDLAYSWDFGDGRTSTSPSGILDFVDPGTYTVRLTVTDDSGLSSVAAASLVVEGEDSFVRQVLYLTNLERRAQSLAPLKGNAILDGVALAHAEDMAEKDYLSHTGLDGRSPFQRMTQAGYAYSTAGENIAAGYSTPQEVMEGWMASPGHKANILTAGFRELGVGYYYDEADTFPGPYGYHYYWVQNFGARNLVYPVVIENEAYDTADATVEVYIHGSGWAVTMAVSEDPDFAGAVWQAYSPTVTWQLSPGAGLKTVHVRLRNGASDEIEASDEIVLR